jgi:beta-galactosidase
VKKAKAFEPAELVNRVSLFETIDTISECHHSFYPKNMEQFDQSTGYTQISS